MNFPSTRYLSTHVRSSRHQGIQAPSLVIFTIAGIYNPSTYQSPADHSTPLVIFTIRVIFRNHSTSLAFFTIRTSSNTSSSLKPAPNPPITFTCAKSTMQNWLSWWTPLQPGTYLPMSDPPVTKVYKHPPLVIFTITALGVPTMGAALFIEIRFYNPN